MQLASPTLQPGPSTRPLLQELLRPSSPAQQARWPAPPQDFGARQMSLVVAPMKVQAVPPQARLVPVPKMKVPLLQGVLTLLYSKQPMQQARSPSPPPACAGRGARRTV